MSTTDYTGRQVDLELLQSIAVPGPMAQRVHITNVGQAPKVVAGVEKAIQRYAQLLLTTLNDIHFAPELGGTLLQSIMMGTVGDQGTLAHLFCVASAGAVKAMATENVNGAFGTVPQDEWITDASLISIDLNPATQTVGLSVQLTTAAGTQYQFVVPISTAG